MGFIRKKRPNKRKKDEIKIILNFELYISLKRPINGSAIMSINRAINKINPTTPILKPIYST